MCARECEHVPACACVCVRACVWLIGLMDLFCLVSNSIQYICVQANSYRYSS